MGKFISLILPARAWRAGAVAIYVLCAAGPARAGSPLPVACGAGVCAGGPSVWVTSGQATSTVSGTRMTVTQGTDKAILNWSEFNIAAGHGVDFRQPGVDSVAINRIHQGSPSQIFGNLTANGQIYLINKNGILFGQGAQVNARGLVASSLDITEEAAKNGVLSPNLLPFNKPAFEGDGRVYVLDDNGQVVTDAAGQPIPVRVAVEQGATLSAAKGGRVALFGQKVENAGRIDSPNGQVVLAAGEKVYLQASSDPGLRGLLVEVDAGGEAWNKVTGEISSSTGNVSLVGLAVNQEGRVSATTSVRANGSIRLLARETVKAVNTGSAVVVSTSNAGSVRLGAASTTEVTPDGNDTELAVDEQAQAQSVIEVMGHDITLKGGATLRAPGGAVSLTALPNPGVTAPSGADPLPPDAASLISLEAGSRIDVAGSTAQASVTRNLVAVELRANELKDAPVQRDGPLRGKTVVVDARVGTPLADVSGTVSAALRRDVRERTASGGTVTLDSQGRVAVDRGAVIDVSGGQVQYTGGVIQTSKLVAADGSLVDIGKADPAASYRGVFQPVVTLTSKKWGTTRTITTPGLGYYDPGYFEGRSAGSLVVAAPRLRLDGTLVGQAVNGVYQRDPAARALGGRLVIGRADGQGLAQPDFRAPAVTLAPGLVLAGTPGVDELWLDTAYLHRGGFTRTEIYSNGVVTLPAAGGPLELAAGSSLNIQASHVDVGSSIHAQSGSLDFRSVDVNPGVLPDTGRRPGIVVSDGVTLDTSGGWVNDLPVLAGIRPTAPLYTGGGAISLSVATSGFTRDTGVEINDSGVTVPRDTAGELVIGNGVRLSADAGAWLDAGGSLHAGDAGAITLAATGGNAALATGTGLRASAFGFTGGGSLTLVANQLVFDGGSADVPRRNDPLAGDAVPFAVSNSWFTGGGFQDFQFRATGGRLPGSGGTDVEPLAISGAIVPVVDRLVIAGDYRGQATGADPRAFTRVETPPAYQQSAANIGFALVPSRQVTRLGDLVAGAGSRIAVGPGGSVTFEGSRHLVLDGGITAPGGTIAARLTPPPGGESGFEGRFGIFVGGSARLDASGTTVLVPSDQGLRQGTVFDGGLISLSADRGNVVLAAGSRLDVSGTAAVLDLPAADAAAAVPNLRATTVASRGGTLSLLAAEGMSLAGVLAGSSGGSGTTRPEGGTLEVAVTRNRNEFRAPSDPGAGFPATPRSILLGAGVAGQLDDGTAHLDPAAVAAGGFDSLKLLADDRLVATTDVDLAVANRLMLQAPTLEAAAGVTQLHLSANAVAIGPRYTGGKLPLAPAGASAGPARLVVDGGIVDLFSDAALTGIGSAAINSATDIRLTGLPRESAGLLAGSFTVAGDLALRARQVYPTTYTDFTLAALGDGRGITVAGNGQAPTPVLAGAGRLTLSADRIVQGGALKAPLGEIRLEAGSSLVLAPGSLTATSAAGAVIPFGQVVAGREWVYESVGGSLQDVLVPPATGVSLSGDAVSLAAGATIDVSGGGDLLAYEFVPGPGGSRDAFAALESPGLYAVLPGLQSAFAPYDTQAFRDSGLRVGDSVHLDGVAGLLVAGDYALLPARYLLLPGAVLVEAVPGTTDITRGQAVTLADGAPVVAGYRSIAGTGLRDSRSTGFAVRPGSYARELAEYRDSLASAFFTAAAAARDAAPPRLPGDAGDLRIVVGNLLDLSGRLLSAPGAGGHGARVDISADSLRIVDAPGDAASGEVQVTAAALVALGADSLLLGGSRAFDDAGTVLTARAGHVAIADGAALGGREIILLARDGITIGDGASLVATGVGKGDATAEQQRIAGTAGSALVRVSVNGQSVLARDSGAAATGDIFIGDGARLAAPGSIAVDAAGVARSFGDYDAGSGALSLASRKLVLGQEQGAVADGLAVSLADLADPAGLTRAGELRFAAGERIEVAAPVALGTGAVRPRRLVLDTPLLTGSLADGDNAALGADTILLTNTGSTGAPTPTSATGVLGLTAGRIEFGRGSMAFDGFAGVNLQAAGGVRVTGDFSLSSAADLAVVAPLVTGAAGRSLEIRAPGRAVSLATSSGPAVVTAGLGAALDVEAGSVGVDTRLEFASGSIRLAADDGDVALGEHASLLAGGRATRLADATVVTSAGDITLVSRGGSVSTAPGSLIDVAAASAGGSGGTLSVYASGVVDLQGEFRGSGGDPAQSGAFRLFAGRLADTLGLGGLLTRLDGAGFHRAVAIETARGDLAVGSGVIARARAVTLAASGGALTVDGQVDASGAGGRIVLAARDDVSLGTLAHLDARSAGASGAGGDVTLNSSQGLIRTAAGSVIDAGGPAGAASGTVLLRAAADEAAGDMGVGSLGGEIRGAGQLILEPVVTRSAGATIDSAAQAGFGSALSDYMATAVATIRDRLGAPAAQALIRPGLELVSSGNVTLASAWDLRNWRYGDDAQPGHLSIRAAGDVIVNADLSDGFVAGGTVQASTLALLDVPTWSLTLTAGADTASALTAATAGRGIESATAGDLRLADNRVIRTGTGAIELGAARDLVLAGRNSQVYTAGVPGRPSASIGTVTRFSRNWLKDGGDITLVAGRDINAVAPTQVMTGWNTRNAGSSGEAEWSVDIGRFRQGVAAMGGGALRASAGRDITNLSAAVLTTRAERQDAPGNYVEWGGGDIDVAAGRDVLSGVFSTWRGDGSLRAGRSIIAGNRAGGADVHTLLSFGNGGFDVVARRDLQLESTVNPTTLAPANSANLYSYDSATTDRLSLTAAGGDLQVFNNFGAFQALVSTAAVGAEQNSGFAVYPATVGLAAPSGEIRLSRTMRLLPAATGGFSAVAAGSITSVAPAVSLLMSDANPATVPGPSSPGTRDDVRTSVNKYRLNAIHVGDDQAARLVAAAGDIDGGIYSFSKAFDVFAGRDVRGVAISGQNTAETQLSVLQAGRDLALVDRDTDTSNDLGYGIEIGGPGRLLVIAQRDLDLGLSRGISSIGNTVAGSLPGASGAAVDAWVGVDGGFAAGVGTFLQRYWGPVYQQELAAYTPFLGAWFAARGRTGLDAGQLWDAYLALPADEQQRFADALPVQKDTVRVEEAGTVVSGYDVALATALPSFGRMVEAGLAYLKSFLPGEPVTAANLGERVIGLGSGDGARFAGLPMVESYFFRELRDAGRQANLGGDFGFVRGQEAIRALFPAGGAWAGDIRLDLSRIYTLDGGDINLLAPGGLLNAGLASVPLTLPEAVRREKSKPANLGIVAQGAGAVSVFADGDVLVNQSRIFTLQGGDILIWSSQGDIDAGRGSKSAISAPPPTITVNPESGAISVEFSDAIAGSGIRGILVRDDVPPGDVDLVAPAGSVNAGDAGIGSAGNLNIAAPQVVGLDNIQVGGVSTGVPADSGGLASSLAGAGSVASSAANSAEAAAAGTAGDQQNSVADAALGWLEVFVEGFGDESLPEDEKRRRQAR